ncbi:hypothetical protein C8F04DRAFT_498786 [Mycena alexandri]|uniref:Uncharacterized protein n=1 Tax=Mycena alexandri TaxID=1745969 RepID=A0AAD6X566_9AGAR|nr:hypothetical protein C8F04DRAFT_498786 [Mycena alexandri]
MFQPFTHINQFYPGLILWCDPNSYEMDVSTLAPNELYDRKKARELRPCLVVAVNNSKQCFQVARICATTPTDTRRWVRIDSPPAITWRLSDAWIWVGTPATVAMELNNAKVMHPHKDVQYTSNPIASTNLQNYWVHRQNYLSWRQMRGESSAPRASVARQQSSSSRSTSGRAIYSTPQNFMPPPPPSQPTTSFMMNPGNAPPPLYPQHPVYTPTHLFNTLSAQPVVVPAGFTETNPNSAGWFRNPATGWFWHASRGLLPPPS